MKKCSKCKIEKSSDEFYRNSRMRDGMHSFCIACHKADNIARKQVNRKNPIYKQREAAYKKQYRATHREAHSDYMKEWHKKNGEAQSTYRKKYRELHPNYFKSYSIANKARINARTRKRQAAKMQRTPCWLSSEDLWLINEIYDLAIIRTNTLGVKWEVDHIIPLQGKTVSGLHVPENLQVILAVSNRMKHNKYEVN